MKTTMPATTIAAVLLMGASASAQGVVLFGDARLGLGYNIDNDGGVVVDDAGQTPDDLRAISRVRFGVNMTGETDSGITFGAEIQADNAEGGEGGEEGQTEGSVFVSGSFGTLTFGDTDAADQQWVGDVPGNFSLTGLTDINETKFISNGGSFGNDTGESFAENPFARPTLRYDFDVEDFGISVSTNRDLTDIAVGAGYAADFGGGSWSVGVGYYRFDAFVAFDDPAFEFVDTDGDDVPDLVVPATEVGELIPGGEQWSVGLAADYERYSFGATWTKVTSDTGDFGRLRGHRSACRRLRHDRRLLGRRLLRQGAERRRQSRLRPPGRRRWLRSDGAGRPRRRRHRQWRHREYLRGERVRRRRQQRDDCRLRDQPELLIRTDRAGWRHSPRHGLTD